jgi:SpoIIAA-like
MNYEITIDYKSKIIRYKHSGIINASDIEQAWRELLNIKEFTQDKYNLLSDYRDGKIEIPVTSLPDIITFMQAIKEIVKGKKQSIIVSDPASTAASILFENGVYKKVGFLVKVFSTEEAAIKWLVR